MNKFFEKDKLPKLTQEETDNLNTCISIKKLIYLLKQKQKNKQKTFLKKISGPDGFTGDYYQIFKGDKNTIFTQILPEN